MAAVGSVGIPCISIRKLNKMAKMKKLTYVEITLNNDDLERLNLGRQVQFTSNGVEFIIDVDR